MWLRSHTRPGPVLSSGLVWRGSSPFSCPVSGLPPVLNRLSLLTWFRSHRPHPFTLLPSPSLTLVSGWSRKIRYHFSNLLSFILRLYTVFTVPPYTYGKWNILISSHLVLSSGTDTWTSWSFSSSPVTKSSIQHTSPDGRTQFNRRLLDPFLLSFIQNNRWEITR